MNPKRFFSTVVITAALFFIGVFACQDRAATGMSQAKADAGDAKDALSEQVKALQKQVSALQARLDGPRVVAAGTATWTRPASQKNDTSTRVKLPAEVVAALGKDYIVLLTSRLPSGDPYFVPHWKAAPDGFDITPVDTAVTATTPASYAVRRTYLIDWIVVKK